uniref:Uncharacterized protein n=1 Tax=Arundo donax TaxID=35708 RepID=A0A0A8Z139_ARUDO
MRIKASNIRNTISGIIKLLSDEMSRLLELGLYIWHILQVKNKIQSNKASNPKTDLRQLDRSMILRVIAIIPHNISHARVRQFHSIVITRNKTL